MRHQAVKVRIYPTEEQKQVLAQHFGCSRWWWNFALNLSIETYQQTGKGLTRAALNAYLPKLKKMEETEWLSECYSQVLQSTTLNLTTAFKNCLLRPYAEETSARAVRFLKEGQDTQDSKARKTSSPFNSPKKSK